MILSSACGASGQVEPQHQRFSKANFVRWRSGHQLTLHRIYIYMCVCVFIYLFVYLFIYSFIYLFIYLFLLYIYICIHVEGKRIKRFTHIYKYIYICLSVCLSVYLQILYISTSILSCCPSALLYSVYPSLIVVCIYIWIIWGFP